jgi:hypothetical protein
MKVLVIFDQAIGARFLLYKELFIKYAKDIPDIYINECIIPMGGSIIIDKHFILNLLDIDNVLFFSRFGLTNYMKLCLSVIKKNITGNIFCFAQNNFYSKGEDFLFYISQTCSTNKKSLCIDMPYHEYLNSNKNEDVINIYVNQSNQNTITEINSFINDNKDFIDENNLQFNLRFSSENSIQYLDNIYDLYKNMSDYHIFFVTNIYTDRIFISELFYSGVIIVSPSKYFNKIEIEKYEIIEIDFDIIPWTKIIDKLFITRKIHSIQFQEKIKNIIEIIQNYKYDKQIENIDTFNKFRINRPIVKQQIKSITQTSQKKTIFLQSKLQRFK